MNTQLKEVPLPIIVTLRESYSPLFCFFSFAQGGGR